MALVLAVLAVSYASSTRAWLRQRSDINGLTAQIAEQQADVTALNQETRRWHDPAYIKTQARLRFGWVMPGETGYRVIGDDGVVLSDGGSDLSDPATVLVDEHREWWDEAWGSVVAAGRDPASAGQPARTPIDRIGVQRDGRSGGRAESRRREGDMPGHR